MPLELAFAKMTYQSQAVTPKAQAAVTPKIETSEKNMPSAKPTEVKPSSNASAPKANGSSPSVDLKIQGAVRTEQMPQRQEKAEEESRSQAATALDNDISIEDIRNAWNSLTHEVSRHKMSLASYLQDGNPYSFKDGKLIIGFASEHLFHKESLEHKDNLRIIMDIFSEKLRRPVVIELKIIEEYTGPTIDPKVDKALNMFKGKVVNQWHND